MKLRQVTHFAMYLLLQFSITTSLYAEDLQNDLAIQEFAKNNRTSVEEMAKLVKKCDDFSNLDKHADQYFCVNFQLTVEDQKLNDRYKNLLKNIKGTSAEAKLIKSQRAWIAFRDAVCKYESDGYSRGRDDYSVITSCKKGKTETRRKELEKYLECTLPGCPGEW